MPNIQSRLDELAITLPEVSAPAANYLPYVIAGDLVYISGQLPFENGAIADTHKGKVGKDVTVEQAADTAKLCILNVLAQLKAACDGDLERVEQCVRLGIFVQSADDFTAQPVVGNGASDMLVAILGDKGKHARAAVGVNALPLGVAVEIDAIFKIA